MTRAGEWFLRSGIQESNGGVARYYRTDLQRNAPVSTEITGYALSALVSLGHFDQAVQAGRFLCLAWDSAAQAMPFELSSPAYSYFFDNGIIVRGLLAAWRVLLDPLFLNTAIAIGHHMLEDFSNGKDFHPVLCLPGKHAAERDPLRWSRSAGCYQLKAAMAFHELAEVTSDGMFVERYERVLSYSLLSHADFLPGHDDPLKVMDRLHAYCYFLEGLLPRINHPRGRGTMKEGIERVACLLREIGPEFERSDVYAQLLRIRVYADRVGAVAIDREAAEFEASRLRSFEAPGGGFYFGRKGGDWLPYLNPVSTVFAMQALALWAGSAATVVELI